MKIIKNNQWHCQYLDNECMYYLTESHPEDGIIGEYFFDTHWELEDFVKEFKIPIFLPENVNISSIQNESEFYLGEEALSLFDFNANVSMYNGDLKGNMFKANYQMTLELIRHASEEALGAMLKKMLQDLDNYIKKELNNGRI